MEQILAQVGDAIGGIFSSPFLQFGVRAFIVYLVVVWLASAYWAFRDMQQRSDNPILPYLAAAGIIVFTPAFFIFAVWIYKIVRPHEKIGEVWERNLAEEALLAEVEAIHHCPTCERRVDDEWIICPTCRTRLNRVCPNCSRLVGLDWSLCAWCGKDFERRPVPAPAPALEPVSATRELTGRIAAPAVGDGTAHAGTAHAGTAHAGTAHAASSPTPPTRASSAGPSQARPPARPSPASSRTTGTSRSGGSTRPTGGVPSAQDPLPER